MWKNNVVNISRPASDVVVGAEAAPTVITEGIHCEGYRDVTVTFTGVTAASYDLQIWVHDGVSWAQATDAAGAVIDVNGIATTWAQSFGVAGFSRFIALVNGGAGFGQVVRQYSVSRF